LNNFTYLIYLPQIIGDEVLNGKIQDTNSRFFAKYCFSKGIEVKKILVVGDEEDEIIESIKSLALKYDFILTSGGIGPTHDDITYQSIAKAFNLNLVLHQETVEKMIKLRKKTSPILNKEAQDAQYRMATLPQGDDVENIYLNDELWVPVVGINQQIFILPGVPQLFESLLTRLIENHLIKRIPNDNKFIRYFVTTEFSESEIAPKLTSLQSKAINDGYNDVKIGSYPHMGLNLNTISILGRFKNDDYIRKVVDYSVEQFKGTEIDPTQEEENSNNLDTVK